jgi:hypothetical protein
VSPICLPWNSNNPGFDLTKVKEAIITGWGRVSNDDAQVNQNFRDFNAPTRLAVKSFHILTLFMVNTSKKIVLEFLGIVRI